MSWLLVRHYAKRSCPISHAFGVFRSGSMIGVITFGVPSSAPLRSGICGEEWQNTVLELNRLCCENTKNVASFLISRSIRMLPSPSIIVSYADTSMGHVGYVYQATNFIYTGLSAKRTDWKVKGLEHLHGSTIADQSRGQENRAEWMREKYGEDFYLEDRPQKHRYIYIHASKIERKKILNALKYPITKYPKGETKTYETGEGMLSQSILFT
jgi:hypothetical protein